MARNECEIGEDVTPSWSGILPALIAILQDSENEEDKHHIKQELKRMACLADMTVARGKN